MELGIFSRTYETDNLEETFRKMKQDKLTHTQFNLSSVGLSTLPDTISQDTLTHIHTLTEFYGITIDALSGTFNMIDPDEEVRQQGCEQFRTQCEIAKELHIPVISLCTGSKNPESKWKWHDDNLKQSSWDDLMCSTDKILTYAEDNHIILGVETEASNIINTPERAAKYLEACGSASVKIIMDAANLFLPQQVSQMHHILDEAFDILGEDIILAHAKDFTFDGSIHFVGAGEGILDFSYYLSLLKKHHYTGPLIMHGLTESRIPASCEFLLEKIANFPDTI